MIAMALCCLFPSCFYLAKKVYGVRKPRVESSSSLLKKAIGIGLDTLDMMTLSSDSFLYRLKYSKLPDADLFDAEGNYIEYRTTDTSCNAGLFGFIPDLEKGGVYKKTGKKTLQTYMNALRDIRGGQAKLSGSGYDFYVFVTWAVWIGRLNKDHSLEWQKLAKSNSKCKIKFVCVDMDFQSHWEPSKREDIIRRVGKRKK